jgi:hypothetical protein
VKEWKDRAEVSFVKDISRFDYLNQQIQEVAEKFSFNHQQLAKIFDLPMTELDGLLNNMASITTEQLDKIERKIAMLCAGFEGLDARERAALFLNDLIKDYMFSTASVAKMIHVEEKDLIDFRQEISIDKNVELKICVNSIMLHFVLHD